MAEQTGGRIAARVLVVAMFGFLVNVWAWALISPLGNAYGRCSGSRACSSRSWSPSRSSWGRWAASPSGR
ncbi:hypothetical protein [Cellulomonas humilata]|uniref:hypothetical protein n=1 Tax=Cellulomonas humilata TaxID=144055 RepID=UPI00158501E1|nr:hypothetical protein [Cellulomonas humilata]